MKMFVVATLPTGICMWLWYFWTLNGVALRGMRWGQPIEINVSCLSLLCFQKLQVACRELSCLQLYYFLRARGLMHKLTVFTVNVRVVVALRFLLLGNGVFTETPLLLNFTTTLHKLTPRVLQLILSSICKYFKVILACIIIWEQESWCSKWLFLLWMWEWELSGLSGFYCSSSPKLRCYWSPVGLNSFFVANSEMASDYGFQSTYCVHWMLLSLICAKIRKFPMTFIDVGVWAKEWWHSKSVDDYST